MSFFALKSAGKYKNSLLAFSLFFEGRPRSVTLFPGAAGADFPALGTLKGCSECLTGGAALPGAVRPVPIPRWQVAARWIWVISCGRKRRRDRSLLKPNSRAFPQLSFAPRALNEFCRVTGSPGQAFPPPVLSSQGTVGDRGSRGFPVFPSHREDAASTRAAGPACERLAGSSVHMLGCLGVAGGAALFVLRRGIPITRGNHPVAPGLVTVCLQLEQQSSLGTVCQWSAEGAARTWTHAAGKQGGCKLSVLLTSLSH